MTYVYWSVLIQYTPRICFPEVVVLCPTAPPPGSGTTTASVSDPPETAFKTVAVCHSRGFATARGTNARSTRTRPSRFIVKNPPNHSLHCIPCPGVFQQPWEFA